MKFVADSKPQPITLTAKEKVLQHILSSPDGATAGELAAKFKTISARTIRYCTQELKMSDLISADKKCRCHGASIYYGVK
jgi:predicted transcriptional regulator